MKRDERELAAFISNKISNALNEEGGDLSSVRQTNLDFYLGEPYGNERDGQSKIVTREVFEAVEWAMPSLIRVFTGNRPVEFQPEGVEDEMAADQETDVINHLLYNQENGFLAIHNWIKDSLMYPNGYAKVWVDYTKDVTRSEYRNLTAQQLVELDEIAEIVSQDSYIMDSPWGQHEMFDVVAEFTQEKPVLRFEAIPPEEVLVDDDLCSVDLDEADFVCHRRKRARTDLINDGFDATMLSQVGEEGESSFSDERTNRRFYDDENPDSSSDDDDSMKSYWVEECFLRYDFDDDGLAERRRVVKIGNTIFENEEYDYQPVVAMSAIIMPHKHSGLGLAEVVKDLQLISSALMRQLLTNLYRINIPRKYVGERALVSGTQTMDALGDAAAEIIPCQDPSAIIPEVVQPLAQAILPVMQEVTSQKQLRTGVNPNISLDPNILKESTMGAFTAAIDHASQRLEMITRVMAETGIKQAMRKAHRMIREHYGHTISMKLRNDWVNVNPTEWKERTNIKINVGVGTINKERRVGQLMQILGMQQQLAPMGLVGPQQMFATLSELIDAAGLEGAERFFINPAKNPQAFQKQPDPMMQAQIAALQAQGQAAMMDGQSKLNRSQVEAQKVQMEAQRAQVEGQERQRESYLKAVETQHKSKLAEFEASLKAGKARSETENINADTALKEAQRIKVLEEARGKDIENDADENGIIELLEADNDSAA